MQVSEGSTGDAVRGVQEEFQFRNLSGDPSKGSQVDGISGPKTNAAVRRAQQPPAAVTDLQMCPQVEQLTCRSAAVLEWPAGDPR